MHVCSYRSGVKQNKCVKLLEEFLQRKCLDAVVLQFCSGNIKTEEQFIVDEFVASLVSFPDRAANVLKTQNRYFMVIVNTKQ